LDFKNYWGVSILKKSETQKATFVSEKSNSGFLKKQPRILKKAT
jgi:hypothetical protein